MAGKTKVMVVLCFFLLAVHVLASGIPPVVDTSLTNHSQHDTGYIVLLIGSGTLYVPSNDYHTIQAAIDTALDGDKIIVSPGSYNENIILKGKNLTLTSTAPDNPDIVDATIINGTSQAAVVTFSGGENNNCFLSGFTITGGARGIYCSNASPSITNCIITGNYDLVGAGIHCENSAPIISYCAITNNSSNQGCGGINGSKGPITNCIITDNYGGGLYACSGQITNCLIAGNYGSGLFFCSGTITSCTITDNFAETRGAGLFLCRGKFENCIIWNNTPMQIFDVGGVISVNYSNVQNGWQGPGNIDSDPFFLDTHSKDYHLLPGSPCIDAGNPDYLPPPNQTDLDGNPRIITERIDMGAFETDTSSALSLHLTLNNLWMYQNLPSRTDSKLTAAVLVINDPMGNSSYTYSWQFILPSDVTTSPTTTAGGEANNSFCTFAAPACDQPKGISDSGKPFKIRIVVTGNDYGNSAVAELQFGIALLGDVNNDSVVNVADNSIINAFWKTGSAAQFTLRDCDINCDDTADITDCNLIDAVWQGLIGQNSVSAPCPLR